MLSKRIIPCLDVKDGRVVKGINFLDLRDAGDPVEQAAVYSREGADEVVFLDITASFEHRRTMLEVVRRTAEQVFIPFTVGGGINNLAQIETILRRGADKISLNTAAVKTPELVRQAARKFGSQCVVVAIDAKRKSHVTRHPPAKAGETSPNDNLAGSSHAKIKTWKPETCGLKPAWEVYIYGGKQPTGIDAVEWAKKVEGLGAGEILLTSMDKDGTKSGYDLELTRAVCAAVMIPVIASGGAGTLHHLYEALSAGKADAVLAASIFHYGEYTIRQTKQYLRRKGIPMRI